MPTDPICGMKAGPDSPFRMVKGGETFYFCSRHCLEKFAAREGLAIDEQACVSCAPRPSGFWRNKTVLAALGLALLCALAAVVPALAPFRDTLVIYFKTIWWAILLGLVIGGIIDYFVPPEVFTYFLSRPQRRTIIYAVGLGFLMSVCSHGILAIAMQLHKKGAATAAVIAFLLASPWANLPLTLMLVGFFGVAKAVYIIFAAIIIAVVTGYLFQFLESRGLLEANKNTVQLAADYSLGRDIRTRVKAYHFSGQQLLVDLRGIWQGGLALGDMVLWWILIGTGLASLFGAYIPQHIFHEYLGPTLPGLMVTLAIATVIEICSEGSAPMAFEIFRQTGALGNSLVFLLAGVATDYTEIGLVWHNIGRRAAIWLPVIAVPQILFWGWLANILF